VVSNAGEGLQRADQGRLGTRSRILTAWDELDQCVDTAVRQHGARILVRLLKRKEDTLNTN